MSFTDYRFVYPETRWDLIGFANFAQMLADRSFWHSFGISIRYTLIVIPTMVALALFVAVIINRVRSLSGFYRWAIYLPAIIPISVTLLMWRHFYSARTGFINANLMALGVQQPPLWLGDVRLALPSVAVADIWCSFGFPTLLFLLGMYSINSEIYEAAAIDGAPRWQQFWRITLPLLRPVLTLVLVLNANILGATEQMMVMTDGGPQDATMSLGLYMYDLAFRFGDMRVGYAAAIGLSVGLIGASLSGFWFRVLRPREGE